MPNVLFKHPLKLIEESLSEFNAAFHEYDSFNPIARRKLFMKSRLFLLLSGCLLMIPHFLMSAESRTWYLPGAAETAGMNGARFSSTLFLCNHDSSAATLQISLIPYEGKTAPAPAVRELAAGQTASIPAVLDALFGLSSDAGTLVISSENDLGLWLTTANVANPAGTYGLALEACNSQTIIPAGYSGHAIWASQGSDFRTNVALTLLDAGSAVKVTVFDSQGQTMGSTTINSSIPMSWQIPITNLIGDKATSLARVEFAVTEGRAVGYTAVVDNVTNDGIAVMAELQGSNPSDLLLDGAALAPGVNGTHWSTGIRLFNPSAKPVDVMIQGLGISCGAASLIKSLPGRKPDGIEQYSGGRRIWLWRRDCRGAAPCRQWSVAGGGPDGQQRSRLPEQGHFQRL